MKGSWYNRKLLYLQYILLKTTILMILYLLKLFYKARASAKIYPFMSAKITKHNTNKSEGVVFSGDACSLSNLLRWISRKLVLIEIINYFATLVDKICLKTLLSFWTLLLVELFLRKKKSNFMNLITKTINFLYIILWLIC